MRALIVVFLLLVVVVVVVGVAAVLLSDGAAAVGKPRVLTVRLDRPLLDYAPVPALPVFDLDPGASLATLYRALDRARHEKEMAGVAVYIQSARFGLAKAHELRRLLASVAEAGKFVDCYLETAGEGTNGTLAYFVATACDHISLAPAGDVNLLGLYADSLFLRGTFDKLKIEPDFQAVGEYKSAGEAFTRHDHSPAARAALSAILDDLYGQLVDAVATARELAPERVRELVDGAPYSAEEALAAGLVDQLAFPDEFEDRLAELAGGEPLLVSASRFGAGGERGRGPLAVVFAQGVIVRGRGGIDAWTRDLYVGSDDMRRLLRELAESDAVKAVVLRIDSPGGSALASDLILREVERLQRVKPVVVSMSDLAASGGYYIAAKAEKIVAEPATLTGSIGVVAGKLVTRRFEEELLGLTHDTLQRGSNAAIYSPLEPMTEVQAEQFGRLMQGVYDRFIGHVASGRTLEPAAVEEVAGGRVWTGERAVGLGLVDELGGLDRALALAREAAGIDDARAGYRYYPRPPGLLEFFFGDDSGLPPLGGAPLERLLAPPRPPGLLELPAPWRALNRPL